MEREGNTPNHCDPTKETRERDVKPFIEWTSHWMTIQITPGAGESTRERGILPKRKTFEEESKMIVEPRLPHLTGGSRKKQVDRQVSCSLLLSETFPSIFSPTSFYHSSF